MGEVGQLKVGGPKQQHGSTGVVTRLKCMISVRQVVGMRIVIYQRQQLAGQGVWSFKAAGSPFFRLDGQDAMLGEGVSSHQPSASVVLHLAPSRDWKRMQKLKG